MNKLIYSLFTLLFYNVTSLIAQVLPAQLHIINHTESEVELRDVVANNPSPKASPGSPCAASPLSFYASLFVVSPGAMMMYDPHDLAQISSPREFVASLALTQDGDGFDFCSGAVVGSPFIYQSGASWQMATVVDLSSASATVIIENAASPK